MLWPLAANPNSHRNDTFVCVASGPSLTERQCRIIEQSGAKTIVVNDTFRRLPEADYLLAFDEPWWKVHHAAVSADFKGRSFTVSDVAAKRYGIEYVEGVNLRGLNKRPGVINTGGNSGYGAVGLAYQLLAKRIILVGFDYQMGPQKQSHWFGEHPRELSRTLPFKSWLERFPQLAADIVAAKIEIINCTESTALTCVPRKPLSEILSR